MKIVFAAEAAQASEWTQVREMLAHELDKKPSPKEVPGVSRGGPVGGGALRVRDGNGRHWRAPLVKLSRAHARSVGREVERVDGVRDRSAPRL